MVSRFLISYSRFLKIHNFSFINKDIPGSLRADFKLKIGDSKNLFKLLHLMSGKGEGISETICFLKESI